MSTTKYDSFLALADPTRREILMMLSKENGTINSIADNFDISRPAISKHIKVLCSTGFIHIEEKGRERHCVLSQEGFREIEDWIAYFERYWQTKMHRLDLYLANKSLGKKNKK